MRSHINRKYPRRAREASRWLLHLVPAVTLGAILAVQYDTAQLRALFMAIPVASMVAALVRTGDENLTSVGELGSVTAISPASQLPDALSA